MVDDRPAHAGAAGDSAAEEREPRPSRDLGALLQPRAIAIVGASDDPSRIGGRPVAYLKAGFAGRVLPVNPGRDRVQGLLAYRSVEDLPDGVDLAILAVSAASTPDTLDACARKGIRAAIIFSSGFAEAGGEGRALQARIAHTAQTTGMAVVGPNCLGLFDTQSGNFATFTTSLDRIRPQPGGLSIISQSGAFGSHLFWLAHDRGIGFRQWITTGNEVDVDVALVLDHLATDPKTRVIMGYAEAIRDGRRFVAALDKARANGKPVIFMKVGRSAVGRVAARSHTASMVGEDAAFDAAMVRGGAFRARTTEELVDIAHAAMRGIYPRGRKVGLVTISGGVGVLMADEASARGLEVAPMPAAARRALTDLLPFASPANPIDITAHAFNEPGLVGRNLEIVLEQGGYDAVLGFFTSVAGSPALAEPLLAGIRKAAEGHADRLVMLSMLAAPELRRRYEEAGFPVFEDPSRALAAIDALCRFGQSMAEPPRPRPCDTTGSVSWPEGPLGEYEAARFLASHGLPVAQAELVRSPADAARAFETMAPRVVLKIASPDIAHKSEVGGVLLAVGSADAAARGYETILENVRRRHPDARIDGVLVARHYEGGTEMIVSVKNDAVFGPLVMVGMGGIFVEILADRACRLAPVDEREASSMIAELRGSALLRGARGRPACDIEALAGVVSALSRLAARLVSGWETIEINPLLVQPEGAVCLDVLLTRTPPDGHAPREIP